MFRPLDSGDLFRLGLLLVLMSLGIRYFVGCAPAPGLDPPGLDPLGPGQGEGEGEGDAGPDEPDAGFLPPQPTFDLETHTRHHACCDCLAAALVPGATCDADEDCLAPPDYTADGTPVDANARCFCRSASCLAGQCGATADLGPESATNAECRCDDPPNCHSFTCGTKCLIGDAMTCVSYLDGGEKAAVRDPVLCGGLCEEECR